MVAESSKTFMEWVLSLPERIWGDEVQTVKYIILGMFLCLLTMWFWIWGPLIMTLPPIFGLLYLFYYLDEVRER